MPVYVYEDEETGFTKEVQHSMNEVNNPSKETLKEITHEGRIMKRVIQAVGLMGFDQHGRSVSEKEMLANKQKQRRERSQMHFRNEILPKTTKLDTSAKKMYEQKFKDAPRKDHEKM